MGIFDGYIVQEEVRCQQEEMRRQYGSLLGQYQDRLGNISNDGLRQAIGQQAAALQSAPKQVQQPEPNPALLLLGEDE